MTICPLIKKPCMKHDCEWYTQLQGTHPQTGVAINEWGCAVAWLPALLIEGSKETRQAAAAIESFRNVMTGDNARFITTVENAAKQLECEEGNQNGA